MNYIPVRTRTFRPNAKLTFDVYVYLQERHVHYMRKLDLVEEDRLNKLINKGVKKLFIREEEEDAYLAYLESALNELEDKNLKLENRAEFARDSMHTEAENVERNLDTVQGFNRTSTRIQKMVGFLSNESGALKSILGSTGVSLDNFQHSANVASLSLGLASQCAITDPNELLSLGLAALLHDIGKTKLGFDGNSPLESLSREEQMRFKKHPETAVEMLSGRRHITPKILRIIVEHEELGESQGYPEKKRIGKLPATSQILSLCNAFDRYSMLKQIAPLECYKQFAADKGSLFNSEQVAILGLLLR